MRPPLKSPEQAVLALSLGWCPAAYPLDRHHHDRFPKDREEVEGLPLVAAWTHTSTVRLFCFCAA